MFYAKRKIYFWILLYFYFYLFFCRENENAILGIDYSKFAVISIKAIQEQQEMIEKQQEEINLMKQELERLKER